jgi:hypothetical protein
MLPLRCRVMLIGTLYIATAILAFKVGVARR